MNPACDRVREQHLEQQREPLSREVVAHLSRCSECAEHCSRQERIVRVLRSLPQRSAPAGLWVSIEREISTGDAVESAASFGVAEVLSKLALREAPADLWNRIQGEIDRREETVWVHRPGSVPVHRWTRWARAAIVVLPLLVGSYLLWSNAPERGRRVELVWKTTDLERHGDLSDPIEQVAFVLGEGSWTEKR